jgi:hypothetical protein
MRDIKGLHGFSCPGNRYVISCNVAVMSRGRTYLSLPGASSRDSRTSYSEANASCSLFTPPQASSLLALAHRGARRVVYADLVQLASAYLPGAPPLHHVQWRKAPWFCLAHVPGAAPGVRRRSQGETPLLLMAHGRLPPTMARVHRQGLRTRRAGIQGHVSVEHVTAPQPLAGTWRDRCRGRMVGRMPTPGPDRD